MEIMGIRIPTIVTENVAVRCDGCLEVIDGTPFRVNFLDIVAPETSVSWAQRPVLNPGPYQFHRDGAHVRQFLAKRGWLFCRKSDVREIMRPIPVPGRDGVWGVCDGLHRDDHELIPA